MIKKFFILFLLYFITSAIYSKSIKKIIIKGNERIEKTTILSYLKIESSQKIDSSKLNSMFKELFATELFSKIRFELIDNNLYINLVENPIINRIALEGNKRVKDDDILPEIFLKPRDIYTLNKVKENLEKILGIYRANGRYAAIAEPKVIFLENVRTLVTHDGGRTMNIIDRKLTDLGYCGTREIINAKFWVPQNRYRVFLVYFLENQEAANYMQQDLISIKESYGKEAKKLSLILEENPDKSFELPKGTWLALQRHKERHKGKTGFGYSLIEDFSKCSNTLSARYAKDGAEILIKQKYWRRPRRLTLNEARALMGFDNDLAMKYGHLNGFPTDICSKAQHYKQFGNAVVPRIVADIAQKINKYI